MNSFLTLTTDFGQGDFDAGVLAGVIWSIAPAAQIADLSHEIERHNVLEAALLLERCTPYFPAGTIHVVVVDPGVGTQRRAIAARLGAQRYVCPDNGIITLVRQRALSANQPVELVHLNQPRYWLPNVSHIFHGRDVFAAAAGHLAAGIPLAELGERIDDAVLLEFLAPERTPQGWRGAVVHVDAFGNLSTNLSVSELQGAVVRTVNIGDAQITGLARTFGDKKPGELTALFDSSEKLCISVVNGSAAARLGSRVGEAVEVALE
ncbi:MAG: SAM-dependent chlorinase/fluorinase [Anaerolineales bacterium]|jgi:S-adenosylmethionine hydrolase|nr:SAM-dependent chlorinase/fluorinase [Anaerolineales bacterium]